MPGTHGSGSWGSDYRSGLVSVINFIHIESDTPASTNIATLPTSRYFPDPMVPRPQFLAFQSKMRMSNLPLIPRSVKVKNSGKIRGRWLLELAGI